MKNLAKMMGEGEGQVWALLGSWELYSRVSWVGNNTRASGYGHLLINKVISSAMPISLFCFNVFPLPNFLFPTLYLTCSLSLSPSMYQSLLLYFLSFSLSLSLFLSLPFFTRKNEENKLQQFCVVLFDYQDF